MAIGTDDAIEKFGTQDDVNSSSAAVASDAYSVSGDTADWTNDDDAPMAAAVLECAFGTAPDANSTVDLYAQHMDIVGTDDSATPDDDAPHFYLGSFPLQNVTTRQHIVIEIPLPNVETSQVYHFFVKNNGGQSMSSGWQLHITPKTIGPHADVSPP